MLTDRDYEVVQFVKDHFKIIRASTLIKLCFPSYRVGAYRLSAICEEKELKRERVYRNQEFLYFYKKPESIPHWLLIPDFYLWLKQKYTIEEFKTKDIMKKGLCPDAEFMWRENGNSYFGMLEVELSNKGFDSKKYVNYYMSKEYEKNYPYCMPEIFLITKLKHGLTKLKSFDKKGNLKFGRMFISDQIYEQEI
jgi:hypothetical protein